MLQVRLLGGVAAEREGEQLSLPPPTGRLLALLALRPGAQDRETVAATLWPGAAGPAARANLRTAVWALRKAVGDDALITSRTAVGLRPEAITVDLADGQRRAAAGDAAAAAALCHGELLPGYAEDWAETARRRQRAELAETLAARAAAAERDGDAAAAAHWSRLRCELDPLNEAAHANLVRQLAAAGDRAGALVAGREVTGRLRDELGVRPGPSLRAALAEARDPGVRRAASVPAGPAGTRPLYGRAAELRTLMAAWTAARAGQGRVVLITGEAGIGKTRLVAELARRAENAGAGTAVGAGVDVGGAAPLATWQELVPQLARGVPGPAGAGRLAGRTRPAGAGRRRAAGPGPAAPAGLLAGAGAAAGIRRGAAAGGVGRGRPARAPGGRGRAPGRPGQHAAVRAHRPAAGRPAGAVRADPPRQAGPPGRRRAARRPGRPRRRGGRARARAAVRGRAGRGGPQRGRPDRPRRRPGDPRRRGQPAAGRGERPGAGRAVLDTGLVIRVRGGLRFRHALLAEAVRADLGDQGRRYEQLALAIEAGAASPDQVAAEVAGHLHRAGRDDLAGPRWQRAARHARSLGAMPEAARFWAEAVRCDPEAADLRLELAEAFGWLGQDADFEREWQAALELFPAERQSVAWSRRGQVLRTVVCNPRASLEAYQRAAGLLPADAPPPLRVNILLGTAWCESAAGDPARTALLLDQVASLVTDPDDTIVAEMANAELMSMIRLSQFTECEAVAARAAAAARRAGRPVVAFGVWIQSACALSGSGDLAGALRAADAAVAATRGMTVLELQCLAARGFVLSRLGRHAEALPLAREQLAMAERMDSAAIAARARHDAGMISLAAGRHAEAAHLLEQALAEGAEVTARPPGWPGPRPWPAPAARTRRRPRCAGRRLSRCAAAISRGRWCRG